MSSNDVRGTVFIIVQSALALVLVGVVAYLYFSGGTAPDALVGLAGIVLGHFFGERTNITRANGYTQGVDAMREALRARDRSS